ncbi:contact-dependent growth inhibition system immunity protein [Paenibacillus illinoisensis]|uniref:contact-dependent growth inhibition system immunity protein n=1 Tax=Paenibacillus illinoisensis TaxID=59845 RepID=UPI003D2C841E
MNKTIQELYGLNQRKESEQDYALDYWYNQLITKTVDKIDIEDASIMLSQRLFVELAIEKAIEFLLVDPLAGEKYDGQLLELLYFIDLNEFNDLPRLKNLLHRINSNLMNIEWFDEEDKKDYCKLLDEFTKKVNK